MRTEKLLKLGKKANSHLKIDYSHYEVDEAVGVIAEALILPLYVGRSLAIPLAGSFGVLLGLCFLLQAGSSGFFYLPVAWATSIPIAILLGILLLLRRIGQDLTLVFHTALDTTQKVFDDSKALRQKAKDKGAKASLYQVFQGVTYMVILPSVHRVLRRRIPILGWILAHIFDFVFRRLMKARKKEFEAIDKDIENAATEEEAVATVSSRMSKLKNGSEKTIKVAMKVLSVPFLLLGILVGGITALLEWMWASLLL